MTGSDDNRQLARAFKALANPNRLAIYQSFVAYQDAREQAAPLPSACLLAEGVRRLTIGAPTISHHIKELSDAGLIRTERQGRQLFCAIDPLMRARLRHFFGEGES